MKKGRPLDIVAFENRFQILVYAANNKSFKTNDIAQAVLSVSNSAIRNYLNDLVQLGYIERISITEYRATDFFKQLFDVKEQNQ